MNKMITRVRVLLGAAPTYLTAAGFVVTGIMHEIADALPGDGATLVVKIGGYLLAAIATAAAIVRRVAPVLDSQKGLLGPKVKTVTVGPPPPEK